jgi:hypothetical protein
VIHIMASMKMTVVSSFYKRMAIFHCGQTYIYIHIYTYPRHKKAGVILEGCNYMYKNVLFFRKI